MDAPARYQLRGRMSDFGIASQPGKPVEAPPPHEAPSATAAAAAAEQPPVPVGTPGVRGGTIEFEATQDGGTATFSIAKGALDLPGVFEEPGGAGR